MSGATTHSTRSESTALVRTPDSSRGAGRPAPVTAAIRLAAGAALLGSRFGIDRLDTAILTMVANRRQLAAFAGTAKAKLRHPVHDSAREARVLHRAIRRASRLDISRETAEKLMNLLIADAREHQTKGESDHSDHSGSSRPGTDRSAFHPARALLRLMPPPRRWKVVTRLVPRLMEEALVETVLSRALAHADLGSSLECVEGRTLGIEIEDLDLQWTLQWREGKLAAVDQGAEATVRGTATDLLLLASRLEDADTLFFQRRLVLTGDTELGLTIRNLLDRIPWETLPLGMRIVMQRAGLFARAARHAHHR